MIQSKKKSYPDVAYADVRARCVACLHAARSVAQADLFELEWDGRAALVKDFSARPWIVRRLWSRAILAREVRALKHLQGIEGIPTLYALAGPEAFVMERLDAERLPHLRHGPPPDGYWERARRLLDQMHERGVAHGDLRRKNLLVGSNGEACLIDFATAIRRKNRGWGGWLHTQLFRRCRRIDQVTFARLKAYFAPDGLDAEERHWLASEPWYLIVGRFLKKRVYRLTKRRFWRDRIRKLWQDKDKE